MVKGATRFGITLSSDIIGTSGADNLSGDTSSQRIEGGAGNDNAICDTLMKAASVFYKRVARQSLPCYASITMES